MQIKSFQKYLLGSDKGLIDAMKKLQSNKYKTLIVVDKNKKLLGTITDGDIRRALLRGYNKVSKIKNILNKRPRKIIYKKKIQYQKNDEAELLPIINNNKIIQSIFINKDNKTKTIIEEKIDILIMAGGFGKRLMPLTKKKPKPLLKINNKILIEYVVENLTKYNFKDIFISIYYKSKKIKDHFNKKKHNLNIKYIEEKKPLGTAGSLSLLNYKRLKEHLIVHNGDIITNLNIRNLIKFHIDFNSDITVCAKEYTNTSPFGEIRYKGHKIQKIIEKPTTKNFFNAGIYVIKKKLIKNMSIQNLSMTTFIEKKITEGFVVNLYPIYEYWIDVGRKDILKQIYNRNFRKNA